MQIAMPENRDFADVTLSRMQPIFELEKNQTKL